MKKLLFTLLCFLVILESCDKENITDTFKTEKNKLKSLSASQIPIPQIQNNRLKFLTLEEYNLFLENIQEVNLSEFNARLRNLGFYSYYSLTKADTSETENLVVENLEFNEIPDDILSTIINYNQEIQIENVIFRLQNNYGFVYEENDKYLVDEFNNLGVTSLENIFGYKDRVLVYKIAEETTTNKTSGGISIFGFGWNTNQTFAYPTPTRRVYGKHWMVNVLFYSSKGIATYNQTYYKSGWWIFSKWGWWDTNVEQISLNYTGTYTVNFTNPIPPINGSYNQTITNFNTYVADKWLSVNGGLTITKGTITLPILNITIPNISPSTAPQSTTVNTLITNHNANGTATSALSWKW